MANEIQTVTVGSFDGAPEGAFFSVDYSLPGAQIGTAVNVPGGGMTAAAAATDYQDVFNNSATAISLGYTISVGGALDGTTLVLTVEFTGTLANTNVDPGEASDWGDVDDPIIATLQDGSPATPSASLFVCGLIQ